jgi:hypothetical protein
MPHHILGRRRGRKHRTRPPNQHNRPPQKPVGGTPRRRLRLVSRVRPPVAGGPIHTGLTRPLEPPTLHRVRGFFFRCVFPIPSLFHSFPSPVFDGEIKPCPESTPYAPTPHLPPPPNPVHPSLSPSRTLQKSATFAVGSHTVPHPSTSALASSAPSTENAASQPTWPTRWPVVSCSNTKQTTHYTTLWPLKRAPAKTKPGVCRRKPTHPIHSFHVA